MSLAPAQPTPPSMPSPILARALDCVADAVIISDLSGIVTYWNDAAAMLYGYTAAEATGRHLEALILPIEVQSDAAATMVELAAGGDAYVGEWSMQDRAGRRFPVKAVTSVVRDGTGLATHLIGISSDISIQKAAAETERVLANVIRSSTDSIITVDLNGLVTAANEATWTIFGRTPQQVRGSHLGAVVPEQARPVITDLLEQVLVGAHVDTAVVPGTRPGGSEMTVSVTLDVLRDDCGQVIGASCTSRDLTGTDALQRGLERQEARFRAWFDQSKLSQSQADVNGELVSVNDAYCRLVGQSRADLVGHASPTAGGLDPGQFELTVRHPDGHSIPLLEDRTVITDATGRPSGLVSFVHDLTPVRSAERRLAQQEAMFRALNRRASDVAIVSDAEMHIIYVSPSVAEIFGYHPMDVTSRIGWDFIHPDDLAATAAALERVLATPDTTERMLLRIRDAHGRWLWIEQTVTNCLHDPAIGGLVTNLRDVTAKHLADEELRRSEARYRAIAETAQEGILVLHPDQSVVFANQKLADILGLGLERTWQATMHTLFPPAVAREAQERLRARPHAGPETYELIYPHPDGGERILSVAATPLPLADDQDGSLAMVSDVTEARRAAAELARQALHDGLTGLPNRTLLLDRLEVAVARRSRAGEAEHPIAVMCLDLDRFKLVNDARGHRVGDLLLVEAADRLLRAVRPGDTVARVGGDEFVILCEDADEAAALTVAGRLRNVLADPIQLGGQRIDIDASIGVALSPPYPGPTLLECADAAMYRAKDEGRGRVRLFDPELATAVQRRVAVGAALRVALKSDGLSLHYQPVVSILTGELEGVEALLRWTHTILGRVSPDEIVAAADELGLALALDRWVILRACSDMADRRPPGIRADTCLSVNISAAHIGGPELDDLLASAVRDTGWPAEQLTLEVTESALMADAPAAVVALSRLRATGITVAIDDFGTGYSSLAYLKRLPVDVLKIDRSFVDQVTEDHESLAIASSVVELARTLGLRAVAEGIETREQAQTLLELGCSSGQGYFWSPAIPLHQVGSSYGRLVVV